MITNKGAQSFKLHADNSLHCLVCRSITSQASIDIENDLETH